MFRHRHRSEVPSLNTASTADISFMLLIFFLVVSSMDSDRGMRRQLPPPAENEELTLDIAKEHVLRVGLGAEGVLTCDGDTLSLAALAGRVKEFAAKAPDVNVVAVEFSREARYDDYFHMQQAIVGAYRQLGVKPRISELTPDPESKEGGRP